MKFQTKIKELALDERTGASPEHDALINEAIGEIISGLYVGTHTFQITAPHFCAGIIMKDGCCIQSAPIIKWMRGRYLLELSDHCKSRGYKLEAITSQ